MSLNLQEVREIIGEEAVDFVLTEMYGLIFCTFTGSGKTTSVLNSIDAAGLRWIYVAPNHKVITQNLERSELRNFNYLHMRGREKCCMRQDLKEFIRNGIRISSFCEDCGFRVETCEYYRNIRDAHINLPNLAITHSHIQSWLPNFLDKEVAEEYVRDEYDVLIIDENPIKCFMHEKSVTRREVSMFRDFCVMAQMNPLIIHTANLLIADPLDYEALLRVDFTMNQYITNKYFSDKVAEFFTRGDMDEVPINILPFLFEIFARKNINPIEQMIYYRSGYLNLSYFKPDALNLGLKIIGLDGTADERVWTSMLGSDDYILRRIDYEYSNAYQLTGGRYPITSWRKKNSNVPARICALVDLIAKNKKRNVLCIGTKYVNAKAAKMITARNVEFATYYALRSLNEFYKTCDTIILMCEPNPPQEKILSCVTLSGWSEEIWRRIFREEEMLQAIGRLRQNILTYKEIIREKMEVYILPSTGIDKLSDTPSLMHEAVPLSMNVLSYHLKVYGGVDNIMLPRQVVLNDLPISLDAIIKKYHDVFKPSLLKKTFGQLLREGLINKPRKKVYSITEQGLKKLNIKAKEARGLIDRGFSF